LSELARASALAPFRVRSFRYQWPADLVTSWAFEMETLILGWYVLVETGSVFLLALFASLQYIGTLIAPFIGVMADRLGRGHVLSAMRAIYAVLAAVLMTFALLGMLTPLYVFIIATLTGLVRPSDMGMRTALVGDTMPAAQLVGAMGIERTTSDSARIAGALSGAGLVALLGIGAAYVCVAALYATSFLLTRKVARMRTTRAIPAPAEGTSPWRELRNAAAYVRRTPHLAGTICLAFLVNLTAYPLTSGLLPYVAKEIYGTDQTGLGYLVAGFAAGALIGSLVMSRQSGAIRAGRMMLVFCGLWYVMIFAFAQVESRGTGIFVLMLVGCAQSLGMVPMAALLLRHSDVQYRGRLMGLRMLAIYGLPVGLMIAGPLISEFGFRPTAMLYALSGLALVIAIGVWWRDDLWRRAAPANRR
jgi:MFS family permease